MEQNGKAELAKLHIVIKVLKERTEYVFILIAIIIMGFLCFDLYCNMRPDWQYDPKLPENRMTVITLALILLIMSLLACHYVRCRLLSQSTHNQNVGQRTLVSTNSQVQLLITDLPPSYESVSCRQEKELPPPYSIVILSPVEAFTTG